MSLSQIAIAGAALALLAPSAAKACGGGGWTLSNKDLGIIAIATVTLPIWIGPALAYGVTVVVVDGVKKGVDSAKDAVRPVAYNSSLTNDAQPRKMTAEEMRPFFDEAEKNPNQVNLFRIGVHLAIAGDLATARRYLRRSIEIAKKQHPDTWESDPQVVSILALANQQMGDIQMRYRIFDEALSFYLETKRLLDNLQQGAKKQVAAAADDNEKNATAAGESSSLLSESSVNHNVAWALLHKALYVMPNKINAEMEKASIFQALSQAAEMLKKTRGASLDYELHYCIAEFYTFTQHFEETCPDKKQGPENKGDADNSEVYDYVQHDFTKPWYKEFVPKFVAEFNEKITPLFSSFLAKLSPTASSPKDPQILLWLIASHYYARCLFVAGGKENTSEARELNRTVFEVVDEGNTGADKSLAIILHDASMWGRREFDEYEANYDLTQCAFLRVQAAVAPLPLSPSDTVSCGTVPHEWIAHTCLRPTWCRSCMKFISFSENQEGCFKCTHCDMRVHKQCKEHLGKDAMCPVASDVQNMADHIHVMKKQTLHHPTWCSKCNDLIKNPFGAFACQSCSTVVHADCLEKMSNALVSEKK